MLEQLYLLETGRKRLDTKPSPSPYCAAKVYGKVQGGPRAAEDQKAELYLIHLQKLDLTELEISPTTLWSPHQCSVVQVEMQETGSSALDALNLLQKPYDMDEFVAGKAESWTALFLHP